MMRTSNFFPLARRYSKQKARSRVQSTTNGGKALDRAFRIIELEVIQVIILVFYFI